MTKQRYILIAVCFVVSIALFLLIEFLYIRFAGESVAAPEIPREPETSGTGPKLTYVVMGDSTAVSQGSTYDRGFARASAQHLAQNYTVTMINTAISGATAQTVLDEQLQKAMSYKPDLVLLAVGANDVTHFTKTKNVEQSLGAIIDGLRSTNPSVKIIVTRSPAVDSVSRFPIGAKQLLKLRVNQLNSSLQPFIESNNLVIAPVAERTRQAFLDDPTLLAADKFHPNERGYALWIPVIKDAIDEALKTSNKN